MNLNPLAIAALAIAGLALGQQPKIYNTVKTKLAAGKQVVGGTISTNDPNVYCAMANAGFDFLWIEMQHAVLTYSEVANMIKNCAGAPAIPFVRVPDATEGDIQKAVDMGALGIIVPMVDDMDKVRRAIRFANYPPKGKRSQGGGQYGALWGSNYRQTANDNIMIVVMIENPEGVAIADQMASEPGVDVVFIASTDLGSFMGRKQGDPVYEAAVTKAQTAILKAGKKVGGPVAWKGARSNYHFFQAGTETSMIRAGAQVVLGGGPEPGARKGVAPIEGSEHNKK